MGRGTRLLMFCAAAVLAATAARAQSALQLDADAFATGWQFSGSSTTRLDRFDAAGDKDASAFPELGFQVFNDFNMNFSRQISQFRRAEGFLFGTLNGSDLRSEKNGIVPERANFTYEDGESGLPFRAEFGDFFGFFTQRTIISTLKGAQVELQPAQSYGGELHSFQFFAGVRAQDFRDNDFGDETAIGASWLIETESTGWSFNYAHDSRRINAESIDSDVYSAAVNHLMDLGDGHRLTLDSEIGFFNGEIAGANGDVEQGTALFFEARGNAQPLDYSFRFERNDEFYQPAGAAVTADRRAFEGNAGYRLDSGIRLRGRGQAIRDGLESNDPTDTFVLGVNLAGPLLRDHVRGLNVNLDSFVQDVENDSQTTSNQTRVLNANASLPIYDRLTGRFSSLYQSVRDRTNNDEVTLTRQFTATLSHPLDFVEGYRGSVSGGFTLRHVDAAATENLDWGPNLNLRVSRDNHSLSVGYNTLIQGASGNNVTDVITSNVSGVYRYVSGPHQFGVEFRYVGRAPDPGQNTDSFQAGLSYTISFDKPATAASRGGAPQALLADGAAGALPAPVGGIDFSRIAPGTPIGEANRNLAAAGISGGASFAEGLVYEEQVFDDVAQRQRLALIADDNVEWVARAVVVIDLSQPGDIASARDIYERLRARLAQTFGDPQTFEQGEFSANLAEDINAGQFIFNSEWRLENGTLRLGFPRRIDGQIRLELHYADDLPPPTETLWSVESLI